MILSGEVSGKMNRVCCGAVKIFMGNKSSPLCTFLQDRVCVAMKAPVGLLSGRAVLRSKMEGHCPDKLGGICDKGYHELQRASRWFCKFYCSKAVIVGLINPKVDFINKYLYKIPPLRAMCSEAGVSSAESGNQYSSGIGIMRPCTAWSILRWRHPRPGHRRR